MAKKPRWSERSEEQKAIKWWEKVPLQLCVWLRILLCGISLRFPHSLTGVWMSKSRGDFPGLIMIPRRAKSHAHFPHSAPWSSKSPPFLHASLVLRRSPTWTIWFLSTSSTRTPLSRKRGSSTKKRRRSTIKLDPISSFCPIPPPQSSVTLLLMACFCGSQGVGLMESLIRIFVQQCAFYPRPVLCVLPRFQSIHLETGPGSQPKPPPVVPTAVFDHQGLYEWMKNKLFSF